MKLSLIFCILIFTVSCRPAGELTRTLHPPHQRYLDRSNPKLKESAPVEGTQSLATGLPAECSLANSPLCVRCKDEEVLVYRCYDYRGRLDGNAECHSNEDVIKCLSRDPPFALHLEYRSSNEKSFRENLATWRQTVQQIWGEKMSAQERAETQKLMNAFEVLAYTLTTKTIVTEQDVHDFANFLNITQEEKVQKVKEYFLEMAATRQAGELKLSETIRGVDELIKQTHGSSPLLERFGTMSLEGLED